MSRYAGAVLEQLDRVFNRGTVSGLSEGKLLERFVVEGDEVAFAALVARYGPMVLGVCRRILRNDQDVEDAFQATFLVLVRRAGAIRDGDLVSHWLHGVAHRVAVRAKAVAARRHRHEGSGLNGAEIISDRTSKDDSRRELRDLLDQELARLPAVLRSPVILCYLEGLTHDEAARRLRWPVGTVRSRLARARARLRQRLARHGLTADGVALSASIARPSVPEAMISTTVRASLSFAANQPTTASVASASAAALAKGILHAMTITKIKLIGATALASLLTFGGVTTLARQFGAPGRTDQPAAVVNQLLKGEADKKTKEAVEAVSIKGDRLVPLYAAVEKMSRDLEASFQVNEGLRSDIRALRDQVEALRLGEQTATVKDAPASTTLRRGVDKRMQDVAKSRLDVERDKSEGQSEPVQSGAGRASTKTAPEKSPRHFRLMGLIMVASARGDRVVMYNSLSAKAIPLQLTVPEGSGHEVSPVANNGINGVLALKIKGHKVNKIPVFDREVGAWYPLDLRVPVDAAIPVMGASVVLYNLGNYIYLFSFKTRSWSALELPGRARPYIDESELQTFNSPLTIDCDGHIYTFYAETDKWEDFDTRAILDRSGDKAKDEIKR